MKLVEELIYHRVLHAEVEKRERLLIRRLFS